MKGKILLSSMVALNLLPITQILASETKNLETVEITSEERRDDLNYNAKELVKSTTRLNLTSRQTPQSLTVITEAKLKDLNINDYQVLLRNVPGVTLNKWDERVYPTARGFAIDYYLLDSMPSFGGFSLGANDMSLLPYERVEVVKGANGLLAGAGNPAASLNFIRKRANSKGLKGSFKLSAGSYDRYGVSGDVQTPVNSDGTVRARLSFMHEDARSYMDYYDRKNSAIYGVVDADIGDNSWLSLGSFYQNLKRHGVRWGGMPAFYTNGSRTNFSKNEIFSQPWTRWDIKTLDFYADFRHYFANEASLNLSYSYRKAKTDSNLLYYGGTVNANGTGNIADLSVYANKREENIHNVDAYANLPYEAFSLQHEFVFGAMYNNYKKSADDVSSYWNSRNTPAGQAFANRTTINFNNLHIEDPRLPYVNQDNADKTIQKAVYFANKLSLSESLKFLVGARMSYYKYRITGGDGNRNFTQELTPYFGITYDINDNHTLYASYTSIFKPQSVKDINNKYLDPIEGKDYEAGIKGEYFDGALQASFGVFKIIQDKLGANTGVKIPGTTTDAYEAKKGVTSKGFELDLNGEVNKNLILSFGLTHFSAKDADGKKYNTDASRTTADIFAKYSISNFRTGVGVQYKSKIYTGSGAKEIEQKAYALANVMFGYKISKNFDIQLNIDNVFNKKYYEGIGNNKMVYGDPRIFNLSFTYSF
ncbi:TonB-dependent siderophore receptor [Campylobacter curvus]|uniref:TonB-dependent siderophore receptor n=1 Tax=Campylobacter curvus TaxID=200 RepID=UPI0003676614|nr:TonB-dependent siderophore receptor [Campylobacter curvus]QKF61299.1 TonB-dependent ferric coprogen/ferric-rhodotorulic acid receptor [Campylobacter curvus]UEB49612.1 TonB-dependent siderophore receptor [Campylobacter curvus]